MSTPGLLLVAMAAACPAALAAQNASPDPTWVHASGIAGATIVSRPGEELRPVIGFQLEVSRTVPIGIGIAGGYWFGGEPGTRKEPDGAWAEATFVYRFHLRLGGHVSPYAGPVLGVVGSRDHPDPRWFFGGRSGLDVPIGGGRALRLEATYRRLSQVPVLGDADLVTAGLGLRWSFPLPGG